MRDMLPRSYLSYYMLLNISYHLEIESFGEEVILNMEIENHRAASDIICGVEACIYEQRNRHILIIRNR